MKKTYIQPQMAVHKVEQSLPIAGSLTPDGATFFDEDATGEGMTKGNDWDIWGNNDSDDDEY